ncbi:sensor histidine kinase [Paenibacillus wulumuqiensis]|uniref:sensor histidine kinase n=1 Tax=Paenibacillus wulumuqiensis TaxID=1567107 RepID=UPI00138E30DA|nr:sensor histidine kinase [Paenibacillus wulumuqiensis]
MVLNWYFIRLTRNRHTAWIYFSIQLFILCLASFMAAYVYGLITIGLFPLLVGQFVYVYYDKIKIGMFMAVLYAIITLFAISEDAMPGVIILLALFTLMNIIVIGIVNLMLQQYYARMRTQNFLDELEIAHRQVEELTVANERQRMARDLHDTLAQGLVGIIMQLEAINVHLSNRNHERAQQIVLSSMEGARHTLAEAREVIDNLRLQSADNITFTDAVREELDRFIGATGIPVTGQIEEFRNLPQLLTEHSLYMIRESLTNITRHAQAQHVEVNVLVVNGSLVIEITDDGKGFDPEQIGRQPGHYGLLGMQERVRIMGGRLSISNHVPQGTHIQIEIPFHTGGYNEI